MLDGAILAVESGRLIGWAVDRERPDRPVSVDVHIDGKLVRKAVADRTCGPTASDPGAHPAGYGAHGFEVELPARTLDGGLHHVSAILAGELTLPDGPEWAQRNVSQPDGTRFERMRWGAHAPEIPDPQLLEGRDGWAFLCNDANGNLDQLLGELRFTEPDLRDYRAILTARHDELEQLGIPYLFAVVPSKETIHPEHLPASTPQVGEPRLTGQLTAALADTDVRIVDLHRPMRAAALDGAELYYRRDCHWNFAGALVGAHALLAALRTSGFPTASLDEQLSWLPTRVKGDLTDKQRVALRDGRLVPISAQTEPEIREPDNKPDLDALGLRRLPTPERLAVSPTRETVILANEHRPDGPTAIVYRDSFGDYLQPFVSTAFSTTTWLWTRTVDLPLIERERPDVVIQVVAERFLPQLPYGDVRLKRRGWSLPRRLAAAGVAR